MSNQKIEEVISNAYVYVEGEQKLEERTNALDFIAHLRANEMEIPLLDPAGGMIDVGYKGEGVITMELEAPGTGDTALVSFISIPSAWTKPDAQADERFKEIVWEHLRHCEINDCGDCSPGLSLTIFGKQFDNICKSSLMFDNPAGEALECAKKAVDARINEINDKACHGENA